MWEIWATYFLSSFSPLTDEPWLCAGREVSVMMKSFLRANLLVQLGTLALGSCMQKDAAN